MAANTEPVFVASPLTVAANTQIGNTVVNSDGTTAKDIVNGATDGSLIQDLNVTSNDTSAVELLVYLHDGTNAFLLGTVDVPAGSGTTTSAPSVSLLNVSNMPALGKRDDGALFIASGQKLQVAASAAVTSGKTVTITALGGNL